MIHGRVYLVRNMIDGKVYVGQTVQPVRRRWFRHCDVIERRFHPLSRAIKLHGREQFVCYEIATATCKKELDRLEIEFIALHRANDPELGYNVTPGSAAPRHTAESKEKIRKANTGHVYSLASRKKMSASAKTRPLVSEETRRRHSAARLGKKRSAETRRKMSESAKGSNNYFFGKHFLGEQNPNFGKKTPDDIRAKISASVKAVKAKQRKSKQSINDS